MNFDHHVIFKRDQVERAIAATTGRFNNAEKRPEPTLKADLKRLLDLDREIGLPKRKGPLSRYAFFDGPPRGQGVDQTYGFEAVFALLLGERLVRGGLTQRRAVMSLRNIRHQLGAQMNAIFSEIQHRARPGISENERKKRAAFGTLIEDVDDMIFLVMPGGHLADLEPYGDLFCSGANGLAGSSQRYAFQKEPTITVELTNLALQLDYELNQIPVRKRGRP